MSEPPVRYAEDFKAGDRFELGSYTVTHEEIIEFARRYDPFPFHLTTAPPRQPCLVESLRAVG
jgi:acyl dehydratase